MSSGTAAEFKAQGNAALQAKNFSLAIENYTKAINLDGSNHVFFSNRSAAYLSKGDAQNAMEDAESCIALNPEFPKGYSRKGAALHALKRYNDSIGAYDAGLLKFPNDAGIKSGLESVKKEKDGPPPGAARSGGMGANPMSSLFGPDLMAKIALDPKLRVHLKDEDFVAKLKRLQSNPNDLSTMMSDPRIMQVFQMILGGAGMGLGGMNDDDEATPEKFSAPAQSPKPKDVKMAESTVEDEEDDEVDLSPAELEAFENKKKSLKAKERGNNLYKSKNFDGAIAAYDEAIKLDGTNMTFFANKASVHLTAKKYDECIEACNEAVEVGKANMAPFEERAKVITRCGKAYQKKGELGKAIEMFESAQLESYDKTTQRLLKNLQLEKKKADTLAYQDDEKADEAKQRGNEFFRNKDFGPAVKEYEEAVKRAPKNAPIRNNLSAALCKVMDFNGAKREIEVALDIDPKYVKAWARKGDIEVVMKENHKAIESYKKGLGLDSTNKSCRDGLHKVTMMINAGQASMTEEEKQERAKHGLADPVIQQILTDPVIRQVLQDFQDNPNAAQSAMLDPGVRSKIEKLIAAGVLQTG